ncbi:hypothetical protein GGE07_000560 [Sinorhizobium terangae]|uniref:nucleotidyltransferase family protein n=3 Tax=Sinorhizobium terangae TaxID=110322 RepID=UPI00161C3BE8|nr:nucleotidyltransferase family protein [Sinorhizobium terangae]MBB4183947.1 hypothetical protein [Sinorhizobium terangae]
MKRLSYRNLLALVSCLNGNPPSNADWDGIIALANESLTVSSLALATRTAQNLPQDVCEYLSLIYERNAERNRRLIAQLTEAVHCLNRIGIEPIVSKGAAILLAQEEGEIGGRMLTDLDILVRPADIAACIGALQGIGYEIRLGAGDGSWPGNPKFHLPTVLDRPTDVGSIDLQCRPKGPASFSDIEWLYRHSRQFALDGGYVHVPSPFAQIVFLILHDQFQDGDYWRGLIDLRHLLDMVKLARSHRIEWEVLRALFAAGYERNAVDTQILTAHALFGAEEVSELSLGRLAHLQLARRRLQVGRDYLVVPLALLTLLTEIVHYSSWDRYGGEPHPSRWLEARRKIRELRRVFRLKPPGKV